MKKGALLLVLAVIIAACGPAAPAAAPTAMPTWTSQPTYTPYPTNTPYPTYTLLPTATPRPTPTATNTARPTPSPTPTRTPMPTDTSTPTARPTCTPTVTPTNTPTPGPTDTPQPTNTPTLAPAPKPTATPAPTKAPVDVSAFPQIGDQVTLGGWAFKVYDVKKRKAVYFYDYSYVAQGHFLIVFVEAVNHQSGTAYFGELRPWVADMAGSVYRESFKASAYAQWQFEGLDGYYHDVNPGALVRMAEAYDLPDSTGDVLLSLQSATEGPKWVYLGHFAQMESED